MKNLKGFTVVELIVSMVLLSVLITLATGIMMSSANMFQSQASANNKQAVANAVTDILSDRLSYAENVSMTPGKPINFVGECFYVSDGKMFLDDISADGTKNLNFPLYTDDFYGENSVQFAVRTHDECLADITVYVIDSEGGEYVTSSTVKMLNIAKATGTSLTPPTANMSTKTGLYLLIS